ncbi:hypothetical protein [Phycicoccus flavus]|uniref:Uncharacterized protein n=1 Tax=Phycicoccus flavus TaxID=2502783 RepID=A0A8T6RDJ8_9MICO|nr:hypothetical protein [Phycicoccus flavus]NHA70241.1 hypothetical protein [Phycicoccus flavus]
MCVPVLVTTAVLTAALAGCGPAGPGPADPSPDGGSGPTTAPSSTPPAPSSPPATPTDPLPRDVSEDPRVQAALEDAEGRVGIVPAEVVVAGFAQVTWDDGSLGCPRPGRAYPQATVDGELLLLRSDQRLMSYHAKDGGPFRYCARPDDGYTVRSG